MILNGAALKHLEGYKKKCCSIHFHHRRIALFYGTEVFLFFDNPQKILHYGGWCAEFRVRSCTLYNFIFLFFIGNEKKM